MLSKEDYALVLEEATKTGADFADLFIEDTCNMNTKMIKNEIDDINTEYLHGAGLRLLHGMEEIYGYTNDLSLEGLLKLANNLNKFFNYERVINKVTFTDFEVPSHVNITKFSTDEDLDIKIKYLKELSTTALNYDKAIIQVISSCFEHSQKVLICNTNGVFKEDKRNQLRYAISVIAADKELRQDAFNSEGGNFTLDYFKNFNFKEMAIKTCKQALTMLHAKPIQGGVYDVVINNGFGGVIFHEACGHALEASSVSRGLSVFCGKLGQKVASDIVTAIDDGTIEDEWGSLNIDDEGSKTKKNVLIENGILKSYMVDFKNSRNMKVDITSSSRRQNYRFLTTSRMTNTYIENGKSTFEEIIENTKYGLFAKTLGGGSVNPATGEFNFAVNEAYMIEDGKITTPIKGATLIGKGSVTLLNIDMVGNNKTLGYGMCGSSSGSIPTTVGEPTIRVKNMTVGGNGGQE